MKMIEIDYLGSNGAVEKTPIIEQAHQALYLLLKDRLRFTQLIDRISGGFLVKPEDKKYLASVREALAHGEVASLTALSQEKPALAALILAYAVYDLEDQVV